MTWTTRLDTHADLVHRMADTLGVDMAEELMRGTVSPQDLRTVIFNCIGCREARACGDWLEAHQGGSDVAPRYCRNKERLERLAHG